MFNGIERGFVVAEYHQIPIGDLCIDTHILWDEGDHNRRMADMMFYMIAKEDGQPAGYELHEAESDYAALRELGACESHNNDKLELWKYHVSELTAYATDGKVELEWKRPDEAGKDPDFSGHFSPMTGYSILRNGHEIATIGVWHFDPPNPPVWITSYTDSTAVNGDTYGYQIIPHPDNNNQDDWSNIKFAAPVDGPGNALQLDGSNDYLEANTVSNDFCFSLFPFPGPLPLTMEAWIYPEEQTINAVILAFNTISGGNHNMIFYNGGSQKFIYYDDNTSYISSTDEFPAGSWYHVAVAIDERNKGILYVNGTQQATFDTPTRTSHGAQFSIGQEWDNAATSQHFKGEIDEVRIWKDARTQEEIQADMNVPLRGDETKLVALWHFNEPYNATFFQTHDATANANDGTLLGYGDSDLPFVPSGAMGIETDVPDQTGDDINQIPATFALYQNYPNPFNPVTQIEYDLPQNAQVKLGLFDILGRKIKILLDEGKQAGYHTYKFDAGNLASGVYLYRIQADNFISTKKMLLMK